jgi:light-harvesting protein B-800-850 alpha chain
MNQGKLWRVVNPSVGIPVYLGAVAVVALVLHGGLILKADWYGAYWNGKKAVVTATVAAPATTTAAAPSK